MPEQDFYVLLAIEFSDGLDEISRAMFSERLEEYGWEPAGVANTWKLLFDARTRNATDSVDSHLKLACQRGRFEREQVKAVIHIGEDEPITL